MEETNRSKTNTSETLTDLLLEFLEATVHEFLYDCSWNVYCNSAAMDNRLLVSSMLQMVQIRLARLPKRCTDLTLAER